MLIDVQGYDFWSKVKLSKKIKFSTNLQTNTGVNNIVVFEIKLAGPIQVFSEAKVVSQFYFNFKRAYHIFLLPIKMLPASVENFLVLLLIFTSADFSFRGP